MLPQVVQGGWPTRGSGDVSKARLAGCQHSFHTLAPLSVQFPSSLLSEDPLPSWQAFPSVLQSLSLLLWVLVYRPWHAIFMQSEERDCRQGGLTKWEDL